MTIGSNQLSSEESLNAERFRRLVLSTSAAVVRVEKNNNGEVLQVTIEVSKGARSNTPLRSDVIDALDELLGIH